jgi:hypothetical protein
MKSVWRKTIAGLEIVGGIVGPVAILRELYGRAIRPDDHANLVVASGGRRAGVWQRQETGSRIVG